MSEECLNHNYCIPSIDYINRFANKYNVNALDELAEAERKEMRESGVVGRFLDYKFKFKKN